MTTQTLLVVSNFRVVLAAIAVIVAFKTGGKK